MAIFDLDEDVIINTIASALEDVGSDVSEDQFNKIAEAINEGMPGVIEILTQGMRDHWKSEAKNSGTGWGNKYAQAVVAEVTGTKGMVYIDEEMIDKGSKKPNAMFVRLVEEGVKSWSIKDALLASDKAKTSSTGIRYIVVPFPVRTPAKKSQGKMASKFGKREMTKAAHDIVKSGGKFSGKLKSGQEVSGLTKYVTKKFHSQYGMFLTVSEKSKGWQYPNIGETPVFPSVISEVNKRVNDVLNAFMKSIVREYTT
jgi:hypothetical protein